MVVARQIFFFFPPGTQCLSDHMSFQGKRRERGPGWAASLAVGSPPSWVGQQRGDAEGASPVEPAPLGSGLGFPGSCSFPSCEMRVITVETPGEIPESAKCLQGLRRAAVIPPWLLWLTPSPHLPGKGRSGSSFSPGRLPVGKRTTHPLIDLAGSTPDPHMPSFPSLCCWLPGRPLRLQAGQPDVVERE